jgi:hypothetical protein
MTGANGSWAEVEFGSARLGNKLRTSRLVQLGAAAERGRGGSITRVCKEPAQREGAYRLLENDNVAASAITSSARRAALARASRKDAYLVVPVDKTSLHLSDPHRTRELGRISSQGHARGIHVMTALVLSQDGVPLGIGAQRYWLRSATHTKRARRSKTVEQKESGRFLDCLEDVYDEAVASNAPRLWFQIDRGGDMKEMFERASAMNCFITFRAAWNRKVEGEEQEYLRPLLAETTPRDLMRVKIGRSGSRRARVVSLELRWLPVKVRLKDHISKTFRYATLMCVQARERGTPPAGEQRIEWTLWTNAPCRNRADVARVVANYALRWRIEDFHRTWKSSCRVEHNWLHSFGAIQRWACILASVSTRIDRLKHLARMSPEAPASVEFSNAELHALYVLRHDRRPPAGFTPSIHQAVRWVADLGGYSGPAYPRGAPGSVTISRGLEWLAPAALIVEKTLKISR